MAVSFAVVYILCPRPIAACSAARRQEGGLHIFACQMTTRSASPAALDAMVEGLASMGAGGGGGGGGGGSAHGLNEIFVCDERERTLAAPPPPPPPPPLFVSNPSSMRTMSFMYETKAHEPLHPARPHVQPQGEKYQKKSRKKMVCILILFVAVIIMIILNALK